MPVLTLGQGSLNSFLSSTPGTNPLPNPSGGTGLFSSTPFSSSLPQPALNISTLGGPAGTNQTLSSGLSLGPSATRPQGLTLGTPGTQALGLGGTFPQTNAPGSLASLIQRPTLIGAPMLPQGASLSPGQPQSLLASAPQPLLTGTTPSLLAGAPHSQLIGAPQSQLIGAPQSLLVGAPQPLLTGTTPSLLAGAPQSLLTGAPQSQLTGAPQSQLTGAPQSLLTGGPQYQLTGAPQSQLTGAPQSQVTSAPQSLLSTPQPTMPGVARGAHQTGYPVGGGPQVCVVSAPSSAAAPAQVLSLGGALPQSGPGSAAQKQSRPNDVKDTEIDPALDQLVASLSGFIRQQKSLQSELCKMENRSLQSCEKEHRTMSRSLAEWKRGVSESSSKVSTLKEESIQDIRVAEVAQRTHELPSSLQGDHSDPKLYFRMLSCQFSDRLQYYQQVVQELGKNFSQLDTRTKTPQEVSEIFKLINDNFLTLASNIYSLHTRVAQLKDNVLSYSNIYSKEIQICFPRRVPSVPSSSSSGQLKSGPTPFSLSEASLLSHRYSMGSLGTDLHMTGSPHAFSPAAQSSPFGLSVGSRTQPLPLSATLQSPASRFTSFTNPAHAHTPQTLTQKASQLPSINLSLNPQHSPVPTQYSAPAGFSPRRRGSISGESEESKRMK